MSQGDEWLTPRWVFDAAVALFGPFLLDVCAIDGRLCRDFLSPEEDGLKAPWWGPTCWCNPPYSKPGPWAEKAVAEVHQSQIRVVLLLPSDTSTKMFHSLAQHAHIMLLDQRIRFEGAPGSPKFGNMLARVAPDTLDHGMVFTGSIRRYAP